MLVQEGLESMLQTPAFAGVVVGQGAPQPELAGRPVQGQGRDVISRYGNVFYKPLVRVFFPPAYG